MHTPLSRLVIVPMSSRGRRGICGGGKVCTSPDASPLRLAQHDILVPCHQRKFPGKVPYYEPIKSAAIVLCHEALPQNCHPERRETLRLAQGDTLGLAIEAKLCYEGEGFCASRRMLLV